MKKLEIIIMTLLKRTFSLLFISIILILCLAQFKSCFTLTKPNKSALSSDSEVIEASPFNLKHQRIIEKLNYIYESLEFSTTDNRTVYFVIDDSSLNAASFGSGVFLFWETLDDLPDWAIDAVLAHEVAHDLLLHSRKMRDLDDVRSFFTEVLSFFGGVDRSTESTLHEWTSKLTLPKYSQELEFQADEKAVSILSTCGYENPVAVYASTLNHIRTDYGDSGGGFFDYHPSTEERIQRILSLK